MEEGRFRMPENRLLETEFGTEREREVRRGYWRRNLELRERGR